MIPLSGPWACRVSSVFWSPIDPPGSHICNTWRIHVDIWQNEYNIVKLKNKIKLNLKKGFSLNTEHPLPKSQGTITFLLPSVVCSHCSFFTVPCSPSSVEFSDVVLVLVSVSNKFLGPNISLKDPAIHLRSRGKNHFPLCQCLGVQDYMCVCVCVWMCVCMWICVCMCVWMCVCVCVCECEGRCLLKHYKSSLQPQPESR